MRASREPEKDDKADSGRRRNPHSLAVISDGAVLNGFLRSTASIRLSGSFKGTIIADHELVIAPEGRVEARVKARRAVIAGVFEGDMVVLEELEIAPGGRFIGTLFQKEPVLSVSRGGRFEAQSIFVDDLEAVIAPWGGPPPPLPARRDEGGGAHIALDEIKL
ncbi:MAG: polymer-forming cytoskeletal protein [Candidatus Aminicenantales bacterium]|jgi:cytoskeletal protein CcmA (bactofilin family)